VVTEVVRLLQKPKRWFASGPLEEHLLAQWVTGVMIAVHWGLGIAILAGGTQRFSIPSYLPLIDLVSGNTWIWGVVIVLSAVLMMTPFKVLNCAGLFIGVLWMNMWVAMFAVALINYPTSAATPVVAYAGFAMIDAALLTARVLDKSER
jgi:hypothetical protein